MFFPLPITPDYKAIFLSTYVNETFKTLYDEANVNFSNQRYADAASTFEHLIRIAMQEGNPEDAIYFFYRAIVAWKAAKRTDQVIKSYQAMADMAVKQGTKLGLEQLKTEKSVAKRIEIAKQVISMVKKLNNKEMETELKHQLLRDLVDLSNKYDLTEKEKMPLLDQAIALATSFEIPDQKLLEKLRKNLALVYEELAKQAVEDTAFPSEEVAIKHLMSAITIYSLLNEKKKVLELEDKVKELSKQTK